jgi:hypothetical protein
MSDREKKIAEIRKSLDAATPGPWVYDDIYDDIYADKTDVIVCYTVGPEDGLLIANAPEWLGFLLNELERVNRERDKLIEGLHNYMKELDRRYQKAHRNYDIDCDHHQLGMAEAYEVAERRLRDILKEIGVNVE